ncbi:hypothetical protein SLEP1_g50978 [Rubroshorea leprosula]|uniref:Cupin type-1 domain-containing protein n=1 Tax=Rubroshorea leprosula TaxID=152421 RepID=A0AAV5M377_9ROSI|nr:hypothetical protein SLEP1_g50978 [Rubroshorea leprosula]
MVFLIKEGSVLFKMVSPQLPRQRQEEQSAEGEEEQRSGQYQRVTARANPGDIFITLADHPVSLIASQNEDMKAIGFGINAKNSQRIFLAGRNNIVRNMEREAQELSFGVPARLVEQVFNNQEESHFLSASQKRQQREKPVSFI